MHNIDDCLFRTSLSINIQGDAELTDFEVRMEASYQEFANAYFRKLIDKPQNGWRLAKRNETRRLATGHEEILNIVRDTLKGIGYDVEAIFRESEDPFGITLSTIGDDALRVAFTNAINAGLILVPYTGIKFKDCALCISFELENSQSIYQYNWRSRWALILVNSLVNSSKTSARNFQKAAVFIRHFRKRLFRRPMRQD